MPARFVVGLTGGIGSGKSLIANMFADRGASIVDTDQIAHALTGPNGAAMPDILAEFGAQMADSHGAMDRAKMRELVFRERAGRIAEVTDAYPNADWIPLASKLAALTLVIFAFYATGIVVATIYQLIKGGVDFEFALYLKKMLVDCTPFVLMAVLAVFLQVVTNNKFIGYLLMLVYLVLRGVLVYLVIVCRECQLLAPRPGTGPADYVLSPEALRAEEERLEPPRE